MRRFSVIVRDMFNMSRTARPMNCQPFIGLP
ncbi:hypothetical protein K353_02500 [Kitasatospora sp. SolWspMP-SS2h]|nr:hypothetical protein K353_02500 [Kitasatospora sp. SolWspMP-SS2h]